MIAARKLLTAGGSAGTTYFDGTEVETLDPAGEIYHGGSVEFLMKAEAIPSLYTTIYHESGTGVSLTIDIYQTTGTVRALYYYGNTYYLTGPVITPGLWYRIRVEVGGGQVRLYVDRQLVDQITRSPGGAINGTALGNRVGGGTTGFKGWIMGFTRESS